MAANIESIITRVRRYNPKADVALIRHAHDYARAKHEGQFRKTGEPYIMHPIEVADILAGLEMDAPSVAAGFLHDVIEDCGVTTEQLTQEFDAEIAMLVDGVTKLKLADFERLAPELAAKAAVTKGDVKPDARRKKRLETHSSAENLRKILLAMAKDFRVMVIKLSDRLHNMRTLQGLSPERQKKVAEETMQIFAPLAHRLGIWQVKWQLEDLAFKYLYPEKYQEVSEKVARTRREREKDIKDAMFKLKNAFAQAGFTPEINGRPKHLWSIYNKMRKQEIEIADIYDLIALRVITNSVGECYEALGIVHDLFLPIPGKFDDYIAKRKSNLYQSLHTKVFGPRGEPLEIQIRTWDMHKVAEYGIAAHWAYKEKGEEGKAQADFDRKMSVLRQQLFDWQQDNTNSSEFLSSVVSDLFTDQVFVFTPKGDVIDLPAGATPVDFAFRIHSNVGEHCVAAKVNGKIVSLPYVFKNGDICDIVTRPSANPSLDWLTFVKTSHAKSRIKSYFRKQRYAENVAQGREMLGEELIRLSLPIELLKDSKKLLPIAHVLNKESVEDMFAALGFGDVSLASIANRLRPDFDTADHRDPRELRDLAGLGDNDVRVLRKGSGMATMLIAPGGVDGVAITRARCCLPLPGDNVIGYVSRGKGLVLHRDGCANVASWRTNEAERLIEIDWQPDDNARFETGIILETVDRFNLLRDVTEIFSENRTFILGIHTRSNKHSNTAILRIDFESSSVNHINMLITKLHSLEDLLSIRRLGVGAEEPPPVLQN